MSIKLLLELIPFCQYYKARFKEKNKHVEAKAGRQIKMRITWGMAHFNP
jgi:hypothetical protein